VNRAVLRVKHLALSRFRGFVNVDPVTLNTDADVILITGPNGFGKTSLIDALCLLLTKHYYEERRPLTSCLNTHGPSPGSDFALIRALVELEDLGERTVELTVKDTSKGLPDILFPDGLGPVDLPSELAARSSFFYQDLLDKLFEEEDDQGTRLLEFLAPIPKEVKDIQQAITQAKGEWQKWASSELQKMASKEGLPSEEEIGQKRKDAAIAFKQAWYKLVEVSEAEIGIALPYRSEEWLFVLKSDNLRSGWERELRNLAADCLGQVSPDRLPFNADDTVPTSLRLIEEALGVLRNRAVYQVKGIREKLSYLLEDLPDEATFLPPEDCAKEEQEIAETSGMVDELRKELALLERLEGQFDNPNGGPDFLAILMTLRDRGREWLRLPDVGPDLHPPSQVTEWLSMAISYDMDGLVEQLTCWKETITGKRREAMEQVSNLQKLIRTKKTVLEKSRAMHELLRDPRLESELTPNGEVSLPVKVARLKELLQGNGRENNVLKAIENVQRAITNWLQLEEQDHRRKTALRQKASYNVAKESVDSISEALTREEGKNSILKGVLVTSEKTIEDFKKIVNEVLDRFRLVEGVRPVSFSPRRVRKGEPLLQIKAGDGRPLSAFSTGQKAQLGLSVLLGLNYSLHRYIRHNIIALDDVTTAFDMAQLPRTAALIRQIAYATEEPSIRRQVFIVSHHEDLTNRLLDFLIPPKGRELRILNFTGWSSDTGPEIDRRRVIPALPACEKKKLERGLQSILAMDSL